MSNSGVIVIKPLHIRCTSFSSNGHFHLRFKDIKQLLSTQNINLVKLKLSRLQTDVFSVFDFGLGLTIFNEGMCGAYSI